MNLADPLAQLGVGDLAARGNVLQALVVGGAGDLDMSQRFLTLRPATSFASMANSASGRCFLLWPVQRATACEPLRNGWRGSGWPWKSRKPPLNGCRRGAGDAGGTEAWWRRRGRGGGGASGDLLLSGGEQTDGATRRLTRRLRRCGQPWLVAGSNPAGGATPQTGGWSEAPRGQVQVAQKRGIRRVAGAVRQLPSSRYLTWAEYRLEWTGRKGWPIGEEGRVVGVPRRWTDSSQVGDVAARAIAPMEIRRWRAE